MNIRASAIVAAAFVIVAGYHVFAIASHVDHEVARHAVFVAINLAFAVAFALRWRHVIVPIALLTAQQFWSHGRDFIDARARGEWDVASLVVLVSIPIVVLIAARLALDAPKRR